MLAPTVMSDTVNDSKPSVENFDQLVHKYCGHGRWQTAQLVFLSFSFLVLPLFSMSLVYVGATPSHKCADGFAGNLTYSDLPDSTIECRSYEDNSSCTSWLFDTSVYYSSVVTEWDLVCSRKYMLSLLQAAIMLGGLVGSLVASLLGDVFGRKPLFVTAVLIFVSMAIFSAFSPSFLVLLSCRILLGVSMSMMIEGETLILTELVPPGKRASNIILLMAPFPVGFMIVALMAYFIRSHKILQIALAAPTVILLLSFVVVSESARWLIFQGRYEEASSVMQKGASWNRKTIENKEVLIDEMKSIQNAKRQPHTHKQSDHRLKIIYGNLKELFSTRRMRLNVLIGMFLRFTACCGYFGVSFDVAQLSANPFLAGALSGLIELPVYFLYPVINKIGRVKFTAISFLTTAVSLLLLLVSSNQTIWLVLGLIGKFAVTAAFCVVYIHNPEYLPTTVRAFGSALSQTAMRFGGVAAAFIVDLTSQWHELAPSVIFGLMAVLAAGLSLILPETVGCPLPETVSDVDLLYSPQSAAKEPKNRGE